MSFSKTEKVDGCVCYNFEKSMFACPVHKELAIERTSNVSLPWTQESPFTKIIIEWAKANDIPTNPAAEGKEE